MLILIVLSVVLTWTAWAFVCVGIGSLVLRGFASAAEAGITESFWVGLATITAFLEMWHFVRPVDWMALAVVGAVAIAGNQVGLKRVGREIRASGIGAGILYGLIVLLTAIRATGVCDHYDTGLYGAQAVRWINTYSVVPGLGNLLAQLGFNSSVFLWVALMNQGPWRGVGHHFFCGFVLVALAASVVGACARLWRGESSRASDWFAAMLLVPVVFNAMTVRIVGTNTDLPTTVICLAAAYMTLWGLERSAEATDRGAQDAARVRFMIGMILFAVALTFKLSSLVFAALGWILALAGLWCAQKTEAPRRKALSWAVAISVLVVVPWICRGYVSTGYPAFPSTALGVPFAWRVPPSGAALQAEFARSFARIPQIPLANTTGFQWLGTWFRGVSISREAVKIPLSLVLGGLAALIFRLSLRGDRIPRWVWLAGPSMAGLVFWFFEAPALRFGEAAIWTTAATLGAFAASTFFTSAVRGRFALAGLAATALWSADPRSAWKDGFRPLLSVRTLSPLPQPALEKHQTTSGLVVKVPIESNQCWDAELPCSPYFNDSLRLREPKAIGRGFMADGLPEDIHHNK
jgi:hypothetical protein